MLGSTIGTAGRGFVAFFAGIVIGGSALAQATAPIPTPSAPPPNAAATPPATPATAPAAPLLSSGQLDQLLAPIALYPDPLLAQILAASTYPLEVVEAARWVKNPPTRN